MKLLALAFALLVVAACSIQPDPPPHFASSAFGGMGNEMAKCMQYASQSYCEDQVWGGNAHREAGATNVSK